MKYKILKKAIRINSYNINNDIFNINLSLMSYKKAIFTESMSIKHTKSLHSDITQSILNFKNLDKYKIAELKIDTENTTQTSSNTLSQEYNFINNLSDIKYIDLYYPEITDTNYSIGNISRYIGKFLNHNTLIEISPKDFNNINQKKLDIHFEAYDTTIIPWKLTGTREDVFKENSLSLNKLKTLFGDFNTFYGLDEFDSGPFYLTIYDEIPNLYTIGKELIYNDTLTNYSGDYHYIKGKLWSGKSDSIGPNLLLIEGYIESFGDDTAGADIISDVNDAINKITKELDKFPGILDGLKGEMDSLVSDFEKDLQQSIDEFLEGSDLKDVFNESYKDAMDLQINPEKQSEIEKKYEDKLDKLQLSDDDKKKVRKKGPKLPKIKIPNVHIGRKPHPEGTDHNSETGF